MEASVIESVAQQETYKRISGTTAGTGIRVRVPSSLPRPACDPQSCVTMDFHTGSTVLPGNKGNLVLERERVARALGTVSGAGQRRPFPCLWEAHVELSSLDES